jgi:signal transduction histidine kinase/DNA-binding response OmpR family regulator
VIALAITIAPPWWRTVWAFVVYGLCVVGLIFGAYRLRLRQIHLTQQAEMEHFHAERLAEVDRLKSRFFSNISHEFRTPLTLILGLNEQLHEFIHDPSLLRQKQRIIADNAQKLYALVGQLLDFARLESGTMTLQVSRGDLVEFLRRTVMSLESWAERKKITLLFNADIEAAEGYFDHDKLEKIVNNLMSNALKFTPDGGRVAVAVTQVRIQDTESRPQNSTQHNGIAIAVTDTGSGITAEHLPHIFDRFYRVDDTHTTEGTGIGLALTKELVELHRGTIRVGSTPGEGTVLTVELPTSRAAYRPEQIVDKSPGHEKVDITPVGLTAEGPKGSPTSGPNNGRPIILIVEDNADLRQYIREYLEPEYAVNEAQNGRSGYDRAVEIVPDIVISDVMMPEMDGMELCRALKHDVRTSHVPVILLTARAGTDSKIEGLETGADDYLTKPFDARELAARVRNLVEQRRELRKKFSAGAVLRPGEVTVTSLDNALLRRAMAYVEQRIADENLSIDDLARELSVSRATLNRKLHAITDLSPAEFIRYFRLQRARELLEKRAGSVAEIAYQVGFGSPSHFSAAFHERFGIPPSEIPKKTN